MANRRMFSKTITSSSSFLMMPVSSQNLYFQLGMNADDDGFCEHFTIMRMIEAKPDDLKILAAKEFVQIFDDKVLVIKDWKENNFIRSDRYTPSKYLETYKEEILQISRESVNLKLGIPDVIPVVDKRSTEVRLGKVRLGKKYIAAKPAAPFILKEEIQKMEESPRRDINVIALYLEHKKPDLKTHEQLSAAIHRHLRAAKALSVFNDDQILKAVAKAKREYPEWVIETLVKLVTK